MEPDGTCTGDQPSGNRSTAIIQMAKVNAFLLAICTEAQTLKQIRPHWPLLAEWT